MDNTTAVQMLIALTAPVAILALAWMVTLEMASFVMVCLSTSYSF